MSNLPKDWELKTLGELVSILTDYTANGSFASLKENVTYFNEPNFAALVRTTDLKKKEFKPERFTDKRGYEFLKKSALYGGEILMANVGSIGEVYIVPEVDFPMTLAPNMYLIKYNDNLINTYAYYFMNSSIFINQLLSKIASTTLQAVNKANFKSIKIPLPPLEEQKKIADILSTVDKKIAFVEENINATEELKKGLMQKLLTEGIGHTEFKDSELGRIPESWEVRKLNDMIENKSILSHLDGNHGGLYPTQSEFVSSGVPYISANMIKNSRIDFSNSKYLTKERASLFRKGVAKNNDILFAHNATVGPVALLKTKLEYVILSTTLTYYRCDSLKLSNLYILYYMQSPKFVNQYEKTMKQSTRNQIPITQQRNLYFVLPPLEEQKQIAEILSTVDKKLENLKEKKQSFEELKKGLMQKLLIGEVRV